MIQMTEAEYNDLKAKAQVYDQVMMKPEPNSDNAIFIKTYDLELWRKEWLEVNDPQDGTDCITPFDQYLYLRPAITSHEYDHSKRAYSERAYAVAALARMALMCGFNAGVGKDDREDCPDEWRVVVYVDTPMGQVSWHCHPDDQWVLKGLPEYTGKWDGTFKSRDGSFAIWNATAQTK